MNTEKIILIPIIFLFVIVTGMAFFYISLPENTSKNKLPTPTTNLTNQLSQPSPNILTPTEVHQPTPTTANTLPKTYPVDQIIAQKLKESGLNPLYQFKNNDPDGRSVVYEDKERKKGFLVVSVMPIFGSKDFYIQYYDLNQNQVFSQWARYVNEKTSFEKSQIFELGINSEKPLSNVDLSKLVKENDVIRMTFQKVLEEDEELKVNIVDKLYIQRFR